MIVDTMSIEEVSDAVLKAAIMSQQKIYNLLDAKRKTYKKIIWRGNKNKFYFTPISFRTDSITFYLCPYSNGKNEFRQYGISYGLFAKFFYHRTNWYTLVLDQFTGVALYQQHFFERYVERHLKEEIPVSIDVVRRFFKETDYLTCSKVYENPLHPNCIYGATKIGVCCGYRSDNSEVWCTYIDEDTLANGDKRKIFDESQYMFVEPEINDGGRGGFKIDIREFCDAA
jgi:hypothetical protein